VEILDPTAELEAVSRPMAERRDGPLKIALLDIRKPRGDVFLDALEQDLVARGHSVVRTGKPTFTKTAPADVRAEIAAQCEAVIEALAD
jgi:hypothetical protein